MSDLFRRALVARTSSYPALVKETESTYARALATIDEFTIDPVGDIVTETERFRSQLRNYDLAMMTCQNRADNLITDLQGDLNSINEYNRQSAPGNRMDELDAVLADAFSKLISIRQSCKEHRKLADRGRKMVNIAQEQKSLRRLVLLVNEMKNLDAEEQGVI